MKAVKVIAISGAVLTVLCVVLAGIGIYMTSRYVQSPAFKEEALDAARGELGTEVRVDQLQVSLFSGVELHGVVIANPEGFSGNLLTAEAFVLHYRLLPLLRRRVEIEQLSLDKPVVVLSQNNKGTWNYENIGTAEGPVTRTNAAQSSAEPKASSGPAKTGSGSPVDIILSKIAITDGSLSMVSDKGAPIVKVDGIGFSSAVNLMDNKLSGTGKAGIEKINLSDKLLVEKAGTSVTLGADQVKLSALSGELADGKISGDVTVNYGGGLQYAVTLQLQNSDVAKLLQQAGSKPVLDGKLNISTVLEGTGGLPTIVGTGRVQIVDGKLMEIPILNVVAGLLQIDALRDLKFSECVVEFSISNNVVQTPVIRLTSPQIQITGKGSVTLADNKLNHDMTLTFTKGALDGSPGVIRDLFTEQSDGSLTIDFHVSGPYNSPKTDLTKRMGQQLIEKGLKKLLQ
jgi:uncharacterized protein involved in outer membrane biogenesis